MDNLAYTESITNACSQYFVNDIEHTENKMMPTIIFFNHLNKLYASVWSSLTYLIISAERNA